MTVLRSYFGRWLGKLSVLLIIAWFLTIIVSINLMVRNASINSTSSGLNLRVDSAQLSNIKNDIKRLKDQNNILRKILLDNNLGTQLNDHIINSKNGQENYSSSNFIHQSDFNITYIEPLLLYEETRRRIKNDIQEMAYFINAELKKLKKDPFKYEDMGEEISAALESFNERKKSLFISLDKLSYFDGYRKWREKEVTELSNLVQKRFKTLQNPQNCQTAKKLLCQINKGCGFGCQIHHLVYCFLVAYGTKRTLILKSKGWKYQKEGWEAVFKPVSDSCQYNGEPYASWPSVDDSKQVVLLPIVDSVYPKPIYQPPSVPADLAHRLEKVHGYPLVWWVGQVIRYLMRPNDETRLLLENKKRKMNFNSPIVGVHVRRTDKIGTEAAFHDVNEYMSKVKEYFDNLEVEPKLRRIYLASDDPKVISDAQKRYPNYEIIADSDVAQSAAMSKRYSNVSLRGILMDIHFLSQCDYLVCTFSSQVCRVAYELMQTYHTDAHDKFASLDDIYYYGGQNPHPQVAIMNHEPKRAEEIQLRINDEIEVHGNHWDGYSKGKNLRTNAIGLFPSFKIKNPIEAIDFPKYEESPI
ncbi:hypothetical protein QAD02_023698 [Eretmocerus hayati]|uniref:Uncharacterized protein n=1 Tax=Eretmocerus hayati TaxID=131215 RepID=A0ACC2PXQ2_9HYME|nr:hypothetical protein QAD02_023698 [Eretmocerus hayati]